MVKDYYTVRDLADMWQLSERTVRALASSGQLKGKIVAKKYIFAKDQVTKFIEQGDEGV